MDNFKNFAEGLLTSGISAGATSAALQTGQGAFFPSGAFKAVLWSKAFANPALAYQAGKAEVVRVTSRSGDALTITRAQGGTSAVNFTGLTVGVINAFLKSDVDDISAGLGGGVVRSAGEPDGSVSVNVVYVDTLSRIAYYNADGTATGWLAFGTAFGGGGSGTPATIPVNAIIDMHGQTIGQVITPTILANGTRGVNGGYSLSATPLTGVEVAASIITRTSLIDILGEVFPAADDLSIRFANTGRLVFFVGIPGAAKSVTFGCWIEFGVPYQGAGSGIWDLISMNASITGPNAIAQLNSGNGGTGVYDLNIESNLTAAAGGGTTHSPSTIVINPGSRYWVSLNTDYVTRIATLKVFTTSGTLRGAVTTNLDPAAVGDAWDTINSVRIGQNEFAVAPGTFNKFQSICMRYGASGSVPVVLGP